MLEKDILFNISILFFSDNDFKSPPAAVVVANILEYVLEREENIVAKEINNA